MKRFNPLRTIMDFEKGEIESQYKGIIECVLVAVSYMFMLGLFQLLVFTQKFENPFLTTAFQVGGYMLFFAVVVLVYKVFLCSIKENNGQMKQQANFKSALFVCIMSLGVFLASLIISYFSRDVADISYFLQFVKDSMSNKLVLVVYACLIGPICEEFVFRGMILDGLSKTYSPIISIVVSSIIFGAIHLNLSQFITGFYLGLISGILFMRYKSIIMCMVLHCGFNTIIIALCILTDLKIYDYLQNMNLAATLLFSIAGIAILSFAWILLNGEIQKKADVSLNS